MLRRVLLILAVVAVIAAALPIALGAIYEREIREQLAVQQWQRFLDVELVSYERGPYRSTGTLRIAYADEYLDQMRGTLQTQTPSPSTNAGVNANIDRALDFLGGDMLVNLEIQHGPITTRGGIRFGLAQVRSEVDASTGSLAKARQTFDVPYLLEGHAWVDFDSTAQFIARVPAIAFDDEDARMDFSGFTMNGDFDYDSRQLTAEGHSDAFEMDAEDGRVALQGIDLSFDGRGFGELLWLGDGHIGVRHVRIQDASGSGREQFAMTDFGMGFGARLSDTEDKVSIDISYDIGAIVGIPNAQLADMALSVSLKNIDVAAAEEYVALSQELSFATPEQVAEHMPELQALAGKMLQGSPGIEVNPLAFSFNGERFLATLDFAFDSDALPDGVDPAVAASNPGLLLGGLAANGQVETSESLANLIVTNIVADQLASGLPADAQVDQAEIDAAASVQGPMMLNGLIQQGFIEQIDQSLSTRFEFADGQLTVNGMEIPLGP